MFEYLQQASLIDVLLFTACVGLAFTSTLLANAKEQGFLPATLRGAVVALLMAVVLTALYMFFSYYSIPFVWHAIAVVLAVICAVFIRQTALS